jgi:glutathione synthase/RimK-type ligase-like ATP-grasp enzyme
MVPLGYQFMNESNSIKCAIHHRPGSFSDRWIEYCENKHISYSLVNCYDSDIIATLRTFHVLLWNWHHGNYRDVRAAPHVIHAAERMGLVVFPSSDTCCTFDNKLAHKYQLESIGAPLVPTCVFYDQDHAMEWLGHTSFPKVFKLSRGAGALNVYLVRNCEEGKSLIKRAFSSGFKHSSGYIKDNIGKLSSRQIRGNYDWLAKLKRLPKTLVNIYRTNKMTGREIGYVYFQDFIPNLKHDTRVVVIGNRAFAFQRGVREKDFRASGSGLIDADPAQIDREYLSIAFGTSDKLNLQCAAYDFVKDQSGKALLLEVSYSFPSSKKCQVKDCPGHWDKDLNWHEGAMHPQDAILEDIISGRTKGVGRTNREGASQ